MEAMTRRTFASLPLAAAAQTEPARPTYCLFSKHLHWLPAGEAAAAARAQGYDGLDLTVRPGGHVPPERVRDGLPAAIEAARRAGATVPMITTAIRDAGSPHAEPILQAMRSAGLRLYRWGGFRYDLSRALEPQLKEFRKLAVELAAMNRQYGVCAMYHTHSGIGQVGASMWDLAQLLDGVDPECAGVNYDIGHATVEGGFGGWIHSARLLAPRMRGVALKDFLWARNARGEWRPAWCPAGEGMVDFARFFAMLKEAGFAGPLQVHIEYPLGGADTGQPNLTLPREEVLARMERDARLLRGLAGRAGLLSAAA
jgi:sugar phosphate isomerase/epimerase